GRHRSERRADAMTMKTSPPGGRPNRSKQTIHDVTSNDDRRKKIFAAAALFFADGQRDRDGGGAQVTARCKTDVVKFASLTESRVDECSIEHRRFGPIIDNGAFGTPTHVRDVVISDFVPFQR